MTLAFLPNIGMPEMVVVGIIMLLLFGRKLPEVGRSLGQGIVEFKRGLKDVTEDIQNETSSSGSESGGAPKFDAANPPKNPDMMSSAHTSSTRIGDQEPVGETQKQSDA